MCDFKVHYLIGFLESINFNGLFKHLLVVKAHLHVQFQSELLIWNFVVYMFEFASLNTVK